VLKWIHIPSFPVFIPLELSNAVCATIVAH
jgi:hypothetical protein